MARMSIDDSLLRDPRVLVLARLCGWSRRETLGALLDVWAVCYDYVTDTLPAEYIDIGAVLPDFAKHIVTAGLATESARGVSLKGVKQRIEYLEAKVEAGRLGGRKSGESRRESSKQTRSTTRSTPQAPPNPIPIVPDLASASVPALALALAQERERSATPSAGLLALSVVPAKAPRKRKDKPFDCTADEREMGERVLAKLGERNGVAYTGCDAHLKLIVERHREGRTELAMRKIIAYCAEGKKWEGDEKMREHLCPETLFGPLTISKYHDAAQSWAAREYPDDKQKAVR